MTNDATVVICAYTVARWAALCRAVESVREQDPQPRQIVVVIDGNDELSQRTRQQFLADPLVMVVDNARTKGLSGARNTGLTHAEGAIVAFLDDDAVAEPGWLGELARVLEQPGVMVAGGWATPLRTEAIPLWWPHEYDWVVGCSHLGLPLVEGPVRNVIGCAMAFRREVFDVAGTFHESMGRVGNSALGCEETELCIRLTSLVGGTPVHLAPTARVRHDVSDDRFTWAYLVKRCFAEGRSKARVRKMVGATALSAESAHIRTTLPRALMRSSTACLRREKGAAQRSAAIVVGLLTAGAGLLVETARGRTQ